MSTPEDLHKTAAAHAAAAAAHHSEAAALHASGDVEDAAAHALQAHGHLILATDASHSIAKGLTTPLPQPSVISSPASSGKKA